MIKLLNIVFVILILAGLVKTNDKQFYCDMIELNNKYDDKCIHVYSQIIFWKKNPSNGKYEVMEFIMVEDRESLNRRPIKQNDERYHVYYKNSEQDKIYHIISPIYKESWTQIDPEIENKKLVPERQRFKLPSYSIIKKLEREMQDE